MDVPIHTGADEFSTGMLLRDHDHEGKFLAVCISCTLGPGSVLEAETNAIHRGLCWLQSLPFRNVLVESDSLLTVRGIHHTQANWLVISLIAAEGFSILD
ncbi:hypothetical protein DCAR_0310685 [Daucus carota subsp. sativus]|uniref:Uncharacterized protein n=1 Tax=Daucus carota subsp. sativus TaxID=79200 RepID=A0A166A3J5_DAUCS|nr:hypothetical protein DCAR_0310685 [Daucus carota subsp. sativus]